MKKIFLILGLTALFALPSYAELTVKDTVDANCMKNQGYSTALINVHKNQLPKLTENR